MIRISSVKFNNELRTTQDLTYLLACIGEKVDITTSFYYEDIAYRTEDNLITLKPDSVDIDSIDNTGVIISQDGQAFADTYVGDTIGIYYGGLFVYVTVSEKFDNGMVRTNYSGIKIEMNIGDYVFNATPFNGLRFAYNLVKTGNSFNSLVDSEYQQLITDVADCTVLTSIPLTFTGLKSYQIGSAVLFGMGGIGGVAGTLGTFVKQSFKIVHSTVITPFFLETQYADLLLSVKPDYFASNSCLNYISQIQLGRNLTNPNGLQTIQVPNALSNTGWFNERFNGGVNNYSLTSLVIKEGATTIDDLRFDTDITVEAIIGNTTDSPFSTGNTKYIFGFNFLPETEDYYQNNGQNQTTNFLFDSKLNTLGSGSLNGANFGNTMQVIKSVTSTFISATSMKVTATINIGSAAKTILQQGDYSRYQMWLITEKHSNTAVNSDKVNLLLQVSEFYVRATNTDMIVANPIKFIAHPYTAIADSITGADYNMFPVDDVVANLDFSINFGAAVAPAITNAGATIKKIQSKVIIKHATEASITLEEFSFNTPTSIYPVVNGKAQNIDFSQDRVFKIPTEIRKTIKCDRTFASDVGDVLYFNYQYPFMQRWEYWESLVIANPPSGIFDSTQPLNGLNNFWHRLSVATGWDLYYDVIFTITQNGTDFTQTISTQILGLHDFDSNAEWASNAIKSYDTTTNAEITNAGLKYIKGFEDVRIEATFDKVSGGMPLISNVGMVIWIETFESGGIGDIRRISSFYATDSQSWFKSTDSSNKIVLSLTGTTFKGVCLIDYTKIPANTKFNVYARIYDRTNINAKQFMNGDDFEFMNGDVYEFQFT